MITRRLITAFIIALVVSGIFTFWLSQKFSKNHAPPPPSKNQYVAAVTNLEPGQAVTQENLRMVDWPASVPLTGAFTTTATLINRVALYPIAAGAPILDRQLSNPGAGTGLTVKIPDGMRAISLRSDEIVGVAGFLLPGTHVDVLVTLRAGNSPEPVTTTVLQDVEVLAAGQKTQPDPEGKATSATVVTLLVKPEDAERVVLASTQGSVHFVLRNGDDNKVFTGSPALLSQISPDVSGSPKAGSTHARIRLAVAKPYSVETILGTKMRMDNF